MSDPRTDEEWEAEMQGRSMFLLINPATGALGIPALRYLWSLDGDVAYAYIDMLDRADISLRHRLNRTWTMAWHERRMVPAHE